MLPFIYVFIALLYWLSWEYEFQTSRKHTKTRTEIFFIGLLWPLIVGFVIIYVLWLLLAGTTRG